MGTFIENSTNRKISGKHKVWATYAPIKITCPNSCELKDKGCYAQLSFVAIFNRRLEKEQEGKTPEQAARIEAASIDAAFPKGVPQDGKKGGRDGRIHVSGDCRTRKAAKIVSAAARRIKLRGAGDVWSYTHAWRNVPRTDWEGVSTLASIKTTSDVPLARSQGYAPAIVVDTHLSDKTYELDGYKFIPCPNQTRDVACVDCRLCFNADRLYQDNLGIAFAAHGALTNKIKTRLKVIT